MRSKAERLAVAGQIAPSLRAAPDRRVALTDAEGSVTGYTTLKEVQRQLLERAKIELEVEGRRPEHVLCKACGTFFRPKKQRGGCVPTFCNACKIGCPRCARRKCICLVCACGEPMSSSATQCLQCQSAAKATALCPKGHAKTGVRKCKGKLIAYCQECARECTRRRRRVVAR